jgi:heme A synthase
MARFLLPLMRSIMALEKDAKGVVPVSMKNIPILRASAWGLAVCTYVVIYTGALVQHTGAIVGCGYQFP